jgi:hypothetical protein
LTGAASPVTASSNLRVPTAHHRFCVLVTDDDPHVNHDATYGGDH